MLVTPGSYFLLRKAGAVLISRNAPDFAFRAFRSCAEHGVAFAGGSFTGGRPVSGFAAAWNVYLFLSCDHGDFREAAARGIAAATLASGPGGRKVESGEVHFALDGDGVLFGPESDLVFRKRGLAAFQRHESRLASSPMTPGPFGAGFLRRLSRLRARATTADGDPRVRISLVTARSAPAHERAIRTLRHWGIAVDEAHFLGHRRKSGFLASAGVDVFLDDGAANIADAAPFVASGLVSRIEPPVPIRARGAART